MTIVTDELIRRRPKSWPKSPQKGGWIRPTEKHKTPFAIAYCLDFKLKALKKISFNVAADERYELFFDGQLIGRGPECGSPEVRFYDVYDLTLTAGNHNFTAIVWSLGELSPYAHMSTGHGFYLHAESGLGALLSTGSGGWRCQQVGGIYFEKMRRPYTTTGSTVEITGKLYPWGIEQGLSKKSKPVRTNVHLQNIKMSPARLPKQIYRKITTGKVRAVIEKLHGKINSPDIIHSEIDNYVNFLNGITLCVPPQSTQRIIIDLENYYCAYPELTVSGGSGSQITLSWAESLFSEDDPYSGKGCRDGVNGKFFAANADRFLPDGGTDRTFRTHWWRCGRYLELTIKTASVELSLDKLELFETRYPLELMSCFESSDPELDAIIGPAIRTLQMCLHETYMDCPYYEQLMYVGDTRLQALVHYVSDRDSRAQRKAIESFAFSQLTNGLIQSRYPCRMQQVIPPFALWWICMVYDYALWRGNHDFISSMLSVIQRILAYFEDMVNDDGLMQASPGWNFMDWTPDWDYDDNRGIPPNGQNGVSGVLNWHYALTLSHAAKLFAMMGDEKQAGVYNSQGRKLAQRMEEVFYVPERNLFADNLNHDKFSEHTQCMAVLSGYMADSFNRQIAEAMLNSDDLAEATIYFSHYVLEALSAVNLTDALMERLQTWKSFSGLGLKTLVERPEPSRSDCHAWSSHPVYHMFASLAGIRPAEFGFAKVRIIAKNIPIKSIKLSMPHPCGTILFSRDNSTFRIKIPENVTGELLINGNIIQIPPGVEWQYTEK